MGWRYRKSINLGLGFRINLSKSGIGYSWGFPGYRVTKMANGGSRTTYSIPGTGISYVEQDGSNSKNEYSSDQLFIGDTETFKNIPIEEIKKNDPILKEINKVVSLNRLANVLLFMTLLVFLNPIFLICLIAGIILKIIISSSKKVKLYYEFDDDSRKMYNSLKEVLIILSTSKKMWQINSSTKVYNTKYNAGSGNNVSRNNAFVTSKMPWFIKTNINIYGLNLKNQKMFFTPDRVLVFRPFGKVFGCTYNDMYLGVVTTKFVESERVCKDAEIVDYTWQYVNKNGSRDLRFSNNKRYPICKYGELTLKSPNGIHTIINFSNHNLTTDIQSNLLNFGNQFNKILEQNDKTKKDDSNKKIVKQKEEKERNENLNKEKNKISNNFNYTLPSIHLLSSIKEQCNSKDEINDNIKSLNNILKTFKINAKVLEVNYGPRFTKYQILLEEGTRLQKLTGISNEIAMGMAVKSIEMQLSTEKTNTVIITVPNKKVNRVSFQEVLPTAIKLTESLNNISDEINDIIGKLKNNNINANIKKENREQLLLALGKDMDGNNIIVNLCSLPNILISGSTGSGISMCINAMISSLLMLYKPNDVNMLLIDTKKVQLNSFNGVPHLLCPVITDSKKATKILQKIVLEIHRRCDMFKNIGVKDIFEYRNYLKINHLVDEMNYIVVFIDDVADLVKISAEDVEYSITEITKLARMTGVYMIVATQRPTSNIISGLIKSNIHARISFSVPSAIDSKIILDTAGAEDLDINGDMLFKSQNNKPPIRIQGSYISDNDISTIVNYTISQQKAHYDENFTMDSKDIRTENIDDCEEPLYNEIVEFVVTQGKASASLLQRRFRLGYNRAAHCIDLLEERGIIGPSNGSKPREVLVKFGDDN